MNHSGVVKHPNLSFPFSVATASTSFSYFSSTELCKWRRIGGLEGVKLIKSKRDWRLNIHGPPEVSGRRISGGEGEGEIHCSKQWKLIIKPPWKKGGGGRIIKENEELLSFSVLTAWDGATFALSHFLFPLAVHFLRIPLGIYLSLSNNLTRVFLHFLADV